jgi:hypothetical protein
VRDASTVDRFGSNCRISKLWDGLARGPGFARQIVSRPLGEHTGRAKLQRGEHTRFGAVPHMVSSHCRVCRCPPHPDHLAPDLAHIRPGLDQAHGGAATERRLSSPRAQPPTGPFSRNWCGSHCVALPAPTAHFFGSFTNFSTHAIRSASL